MKIMLANFAKMINASGGLAKVTSAFANEMVARGHEVSLVYCDEQEGEFFFPVNDKVNAINLVSLGKHTFPKWMKIKREILRPLNIRKAREVNDQFMIKYLKQPLRQILANVKPDVIVASQPVATRMLKNELQVELPVITMSHGDPEDYFHTYPKDEVVALSKSDVCQVLLPSYTHAIKSRFPQMPVEVIGNVVPQYSSKADLLQRKDQYNILFVGRLNKNHKCPHLLIEAFCRLANDFPMWSVELWGDVDDKKYVKYMKYIIKKNRLENRVQFKGVTINVEEVLRSGDVFVMPSAYEGFPLALTEAMSMGLPVVAYKSCCGANELIKDKKNGLLCNDGVESLAEMLKLLMSDKNWRAKLGDNARKDMIQYNGTAIWDKWEDLLLNMAYSKGR